MNMIQFTHYGQPLNAYFTLNEKGELASLKVTDGAYKAQGFDLSENDVLMIQDEIAVELYLTAQDFAANNNAFHA